jgi:hypothetical protein
MVYVRDSAATIRGRRARVRARRFTLSVAPRGTRKGVIVNRALAFLINAEFRGVLTYSSSVAADSGKPGLKGTFKIS